MALLALLASVALLLSLTTRHVSAHALGKPAPPAAPAAATPTVTPTPAVPPTLSLVSPSSGTGPVGAKVTVAGNNWHSAVAVGEIPGSGDCSNQSAWGHTFGHPQPNGSGRLFYSFTWPSSLAQTSGPYVICATNASGTASANFQVVSPAPPALAFSTNAAQVGTLLTINGSNFLGAGQIAITAKGPQSSTHAITTVTPLDNGSFSVPYTPTAREVGTLTVRAASASEGGAPPAIAITAQIKVAAAPTPTPTASPTPTTGIALGGGGTTTNDSGTPVMAIVLVVVAILFVLLALGGVVLFLLLRRRGAGGPDGQDPSFYGMGSQPGGYDPYGQTGYGGAAYDPTGRYSSPGQFGRSGFQDMPGSYGGSSVGGVALWDEAPGDDSEPGPDWHPRPMTGTGHWRAPDAGDYGPGGYDPGMMDPGETAGYAPPDPWAGQGNDPYGTTRAPAGNYGTPGYGQGTNVPPRRGPGSPPPNPWGESWRDAAPPGPPGQQGGYPPQSGSGYGPNDPNGW
jgi:hypothetical protein